MPEDFESAFSPAAWREVQQPQRFCSGIQSYRLVIASVARLDSKRGAKLLHPALPHHQFRIFVTTVDDKRSALRRSGPQASGISLTGQSGNRGLRRTPQMVNSTEFCHQTDTADREVVRCVT
jgi:hypothetical protein